MKRTLSIPAAASLLAAAAFAAVALAPMDADARERKVRAEAQTARGTVSTDSTVTRGKGFRTKTATQTGPNGAQSTVTDSITRNREAGTTSRNRDRTFADGTTRSADSTLQKTGDGTYSGTRTVTGRNGETRTQTGDYTVTQTENGRTIDGVVNTQNHGAVDVNKVVTRTEDGRAVQRTNTFEDGTSTVRNTNTACAEGAGCTTNTAFTNRQGAQTNSVQTRARTETGWAKDRTTTFPDGTTRVVDLDGTKTGEGTANVTRSVAGRDGEVRTQTGSVAVETSPN